MAEIAYDDAPIINSGGVTLSPENSDKLAQRNLQITSSGNPTYPDTHLIPQAFDTRPSRPLVGTGQLQDYPDELMIDWGDLPAGSRASIFWPQVDAKEVLTLANRLYGAHPLSASDAHTVTCKTTNGVTYVPIPPGTGNYAGLFTVELPNTIHVGQEFNTRVRRVASRRSDLKAPGLAVPQQPETINLRTTARTGTTTTETHAFVGGSIGRSRRIMRNWRYVTGTFQVKIPVNTDEKLLHAEENTLAIFKWRLEHFTPGSRWRPVLERYIEYLSKRVDGFGGSAVAIKPSLTGFHPEGEGGEEGEGGFEKLLGTIGKVSGLIYDHFGDFEGFWLELEDGRERRYLSSEHQIENLVRRAWMERILIAVQAEPHQPHRPRSVIYRRASRPYQN